MRNNSLDHLHRELRRTSKRPDIFVLRSLRKHLAHRLGEPSPDAFASVRLKVSERGDLGKSLMGR